MINACTSTSVISSSVHEPVTTLDTLKNLVLKIVSDIKFALDKFVSHPEPKSKLTVQSHPSVEISANYNIVKKITRLPGVEIYPSSDSGNSTAASGLDKLIEGVNKYTCRDDDGCELIPHLINGLASDSIYENCGHKVSRSIFEREHKELDRAMRQWELDQGYEVPDNALTRVGLMS